MPQDRVVYDTAIGRTDRCSYCRRRLEACVCPSQPGRPAPDGTARIRRERKGRRGKTVTVVEGLAVGPQRLEELAAILKRTCGSGGTVATGNLEIQGDHRQRVADKLTELGYRVKLAGG